MGLRDLQGKLCTLLVHIFIQKNTIGHLVCYKGVILSMNGLFFFFFNLKAMVWIPFEKNC